MMSAGNVYAALLAIRNINFASGISEIDRACKISDIVNEAIIQVASEVPVCFIAWKCKGCGTITNSIENYNKVLKKAGHISCCPDSDYQMLVLAHTKTPESSDLIQRILELEALVGKKDETLIQNEQQDAVYQILQSPRHDWEEVSKQQYESYGESGDEGKKRILYTLPPKQVIPDCASKSSDGNAKDAERYRFLRSCDPGAYGLPCVAVPCSEHAGMLLSGEEADQMVDQAIAINKMKEEK